MTSVPADVPAFVELYSDNTELGRGLTQAAGMLKVFGGAITSIGATFAKVGLAGITTGVAGLTAMFGAALKFGSTGDELDKMSKRTGVAVEELSMLKYAALQSGSSLEEVEIAVRRLQRAVFDAAKNQGTVFSAGKGGMTLGNKDVFSEMGLSAKELMKMDMGLMFETVGQKAMAAKNPVQRLGEVLKVMGFHGQGGAKMIPMFMQLAKVMGDAPRMGAVWTQADVDTAVRFEAAYKGIKFQLGRVVETIGLALAPKLSDLIEQTQRPLKAAMDWIRGNQQLVVSLAEVGVKAVIVSGQLFVLGTAIYAVGKTILGVALAFKILAATVGFLVSPFGIVLSLLVAGVAAWAYFTDSGQRSVGYLKDAFTASTEAMKTAWQGLYMALQAGDVALAGKIAFQGLLISWLEIIDAMKRSWAEFAASIKLQEAQKDIAKGMARVVDKLPNDSMGPFAAMKLFLGSPQHGTSGVVDQMEQERQARVAAGLEGPNAVDPALKAAREQLDRLQNEAVVKLTASRIAAMGAAMIKGPAAAVTGTPEGIGEGSLGTLNPFSAQRLPAGDNVLKQSLEAQLRTAEAVEWIKSNPSVMRVI